MDHMIPLSIPNFEGNERKYADDAIEQGWVSTGGAYITKLEKQLADFLGVKEVAACQSGTAGIHLSLIQADVAPGDMVIVPALTFIAAVNPVRYQFADPVFMDCDASLCMDPVKLRQFCEEECFLQGNKLLHRATGRCVKAVIIVHVFGNLADMETIMDIAEQYHLKVIEDATEALGSCFTQGRYAGCYAGTIGHYGAYSFNGNKIITTGGGGAVTSLDPEETIHMRYLSTQAKDDPHYYIHHEIGYNYRMTNVQAAIGAAQMEQLREFIRRKQQNYERYREVFDGFALGKLMGFREGTSSNMWFYSLEIFMDRIQANLRDIISRLQERNVQTRAIWGLIHRQLPYQHAIAYQVEKAEYYGSCILNFPCSTQITEEEILYTAEQIKTVLEELAS